MIQKLQINASSYLPTFPQYSTQKNQLTKINKISSFRPKGNKAFQKHNRTINPAFISVHAIQSLNWLPKLVCIILTFTQILIKSQKPITPIFSFWQTNNSACLHWKIQNKKLKHKVSSEIVIYTIGFKRFYLVLTKVGK